METLDQAETLRKLMNSRQSEHEAAVPSVTRAFTSRLKVFTFASGVDPVGKRNLVFQMSEGFKKEGYKTLLLDAQTQTFTPRDLENLKKNHSDLDFILVNLKTGIQDSTLEMHHPLYRSVVVLTPDSSSMTDAFGLVKLLHQKRSVQRFHVIVNQVTGSDAALKLFNKFCGVVNRFIDVEVNYLGYGKFSENVRHSVLNKKYLLDLKEDDFVSVEG